MAGQRALEAQSGPGSFGGDGKQVDVAGLGARLPVQAAADRFDVPSFPKPIQGVRAQARLVSRAIGFCPGAVVKPAR